MKGIRSFSCLAAACALLLHASVSLAFLDHGRVREYDFTVTWENHAPDGFPRKMLLVNGQSPGPVLKANEGDHVVVNLHNRSPVNTSMHFHGIEMHGTPWSDGVPGVTQRHILPGETFTYRWTATQYGSYWYHAHSKAQIEDGFYGAIIIQPRKSRCHAPFKLISQDKHEVRGIKRAAKRTRPLVISDFTHLTSEKKWDLTVESGTEDSCYDSLLFNGKGSVACLDPEEVAASLSPVQKVSLGVVPNATFTDKSCLPPEVLDALVGGGKGKPEAWPAGVFRGCKETQGPTEIIEVKGRDQSEGTWTALEIVGALNFVNAVFSIDEHEIWVYAMDGSYIKPQKVHGLVLANGDRYSILVKTHAAGDFKIRAHVNSVPQAMTGHAVLSVSGRGKPVTVESKPWIDLVGNPLPEYKDSFVLFNPLAAAPHPPDPIAEAADALFRLDISADGASYLWVLNSTRLMPEDLENRPNPYLFAPEVNETSDVLLTTRNGTWIDLVFHATTWPLPPHTIHKHGSKMYELGTGLGEWKWSSVQEAMQDKDVPEGTFNLVNPPRRDSFQSPMTDKSKAWTVVRYHVTNPGPWLLHCHLSNHMSGGMMMVIQDGVDVTVKVPDEYVAFNEGGR